MLCCDSDADVPTAAEMPGGLWVNVGHLWRRESMSVKLRLTRTGGRNDVCYRCVAADTRSPRDGRFIEILGWYDPRLNGRNFELDLERVEHWRSQGAILSDTVRSLVKRAKQAPAAEVEEAETPKPAAAVAPAADGEPSDSQEPAAAGE